jgi:hypothetical protein
MTRYYLLFDSCCFVLGGGALSDERVGLSLAIVIVGFSLYGLRSNSTENIHCLAMDIREPTQKTPLATRTGTGN